MKEHWDRPGLEEFLGTTERIRDRGQQNNGTNEGDDNNGSHA